MKELTTPWMHWERVFESPGAADLVKSRKPTLGTKEDGPHLQFDVIQPGNVAWNTRKIRFLKDGPSVAKLLEPLFCPVQVNIASPNAKTLVAVPFLFDGAIGRGPGGGDGPQIKTSAADHDKIIAALGQAVGGTTKADVVAPFAFIARSVEDTNYVQQLIAAKIIDAGFRDDVLMVDFTRPVFSDDRCDLLKFAPDLKPADRTAAKIAAGFLTKLKSAEPGTPAGQLKAHLQARKDGEAFDHPETQQAFASACLARQSGEKISIGSSKVSAFHADALKLRSLGRHIAFADGVADGLKGSAAHPFKVFEFDDTMANDDVDVTTSAKPADLTKIHPQARLSPVDCTLVSRFTAAGGPVGGGGDGGSCEGRCGDFTPGASCQCTPECGDFGNCCADLEEVCD
jgi:hypothetical protein